MAGSNRRSFIKSVGIGMAGLAIGAGCETQSRGKGASCSKQPSKLPELALASYTMRKFTLDQTIETAKRIGLTHLCLKSMHLPLESTPEAIQQTAKKVHDAGLDLYACGNINMKNPQQVDQAFEYAKLAGMRVIICAPTFDVFPLLDKKVRDYDIKIAIHNHGPKDTVPIPQAAYDMIKGYDPRVGLCVDVGHTLRAGSDPAQAIRQCADRVFDVHTKDIDKAAPEGSCTEAGHGVLDLRSVLRTLIDVRYTGYCSFEYEKDGNDPVPGLAESVGYVRGLMRCL